MPAAGPDLAKDTADRWKKYLDKADKDHPYLKDWYASKSRSAAEAFQKLTIEVNARKKHVDDENHITLGLNPNRNDLSQADLKSLPRDEYVLWHDLFGDSGV